MKILLILPRPLFPTDTGGKIRTLRIFERLARQTEIHAVSLADAQRDHQAIEQMRRVFKAYTPVFWNEAATFSAGFYAGFLRSRLGRFPYFLEKYRRTALRRAAEQLAAREKFDVVLCDFLQSAVAMLDSPLRPRVIFQHNVEYVIRRRHWETESGALRKRLLNAEWQKARTVEAEVCRTFDHVITVSEDDRHRVAQEFSAASVSDLPTGVDVDYFQPQAGERRSGNLVFVGSMDWHPNEDGIAWFAREVFPSIRKSTPHASLTVVGRNPSARVRELAARDAAIEVTGTVPDVRPYVARAEVLIVPLRIGGGTRIKIFEAMAMERAVVSTTLGAEGLPLRDGVEILLRDSPENFASAVTELLRDARHREALARSGREKVTREHTWQIVAERMRDILAGVATPVPNRQPAAATVVKTGALVAK